MQMWLLILGITAFEQFYARTLLDKGRNRELKIVHTSIFYTH